MLVKADCLKHSSPILKTELPIVTDAKLEHCLKALSPILVTKSGIVILVKFVHKLKILLLIVVKLLFVGKVTETKLEHP